MHRVLTVAAVEGRRRLAADMVEGAVVATFPAVAVAGHSGGGGGHGGGGHGRR